MFDASRIKALTRDRGGRTEDYQGKRLVVTPGWPGRSDDLALAKLQAGSKPGLQAMMQSLEIGGTGKTVALTFSVPGEVFDALGYTPTPR